MKLTHIDLDLDDEEAEVRCPVTGVVVRKALSDVAVPDFQLSPAFVAEWDDVELDTVLFRDPEQAKAWDEFTSDEDFEYENYPDLIEKFLLENPTLFPDDLTLVEHGGVIASHIYSYTLLDNSKAPAAGVENGEPG